MRTLIGFTGIAAAAALAFAAPAAAQSGSGATCTSGPFMVFFDRGQTVLTPQGKAILDNAASAYATCGNAPILVAGHTDRKGTDRANMALSRRIAASVRRYLITLGLPATRITTRAFGESRPLVETADGVSEPQNRRAEIMFGSGW